MKKKILTILMAILLLNVFSSPVYAEEGDDTYTVTVSAGLHGMLVDEKGNLTKKIEVKIGADQDWMWNPNDYLIEEENIDENYYFKGYHIAGIEGALAGAQTITHDIVFVASYGIKNNLVEYYVNYVDETGNPIGPKRNTYKGNVGDKPVIAFIHINGYTPLVENYTVTLEEDEITELTFIYRRVRTETIYVEDESAGIISDNNTAGPQNTPAREETSEETEAPVEIVDIDESKTPEAEPEETQNEAVEEKEEKAEASFFRKYALPLAGGTLFLLLLLFLLLRRRKEDE